jgi:hypothetical protein
MYIWLVFKVCCFSRLLDPELAEPVLAEEDVANSMAGRAFVTGRPVTVERDGGINLWVPLVERGERTGVIASSVTEIDGVLRAEDRPIPGGPHSDVRHGRGHPFKGRTRYGFVYACGTRRAERAIE